jgi:diguanylate cyclase (GGDEF)-like protein/PAS domain S-box-containing protein
MIRLLASRALPRARTSESATEVEGKARAPLPSPGDSAAEVLKSATLDLTRTLELDVIFNSLLEHLRRLVPYDTANVMLLEADSRLIVRAHRGYEQWAEPALTPDAVYDVASHPIFGALLATRRSVLIPDTEAHPDWQRHQGAEHVRNWMGVPLLAADRVIGLYAVDKAVPRFFTSEHLRFTEALAPHAALAIRNARLYEQLQRSEERFRALVDNSNEVVSLLDRDGVTLYSSQSSAAILGDPVEDLVGRTPFERVHPEDQAEVRALFQTALRSPGFPLVSEFRMRHRGGAWRTVEAVLVNRLDDPSVAAAVLNYRDVTERKRAQQKIEDLNRDLQRQVAEFQTLLEVIPIGIGIARDPACRHIEGNPYMARLMGLSPAQNISPSAPDGQSRPTTRLFRDGRALPAEEQPMQRAAAQGTEVVDMEMDVVRDGQKVGTILGYAAPLFDETGRPRGAIGASLDITERKRAEEQIKSLAYHDALTGLPNRRLFQDRLSVAVAQAHRNSQRLAVLFLDLDRFKPVNDSLGHAAGDRLIQEVAERLRTCLREGDTVARLGGDEFTLLLPGVSQVVDAARVAEKVLDALRVPFLIEGRELSSTASIGISLYPEDGRDADTLVKSADAAMYRAKQQGRDNYQLCAPALNATALERLALESSLRHAVGQDELVLHYQPVLDIATGRVQAMEALLRWRHPELGLVPPGDFIPLAEMTGLVIAFSPWVLRTACAQARAWQDAGHADLAVAVNLSARQFQHPDLPSQVKRALEESKLDAACLELEVSETSAMQAPESSTQTLRALKALGVRIAIDDFGTGSSSLSYLRRFPIDALKIDRSFTAEITPDPDDAAVANSVIALAHTLKLRVVAEGVETDDQLAFLSSRRCDQAQGFLFGSPRPAGDCAGLLDAPVRVRAARA